MRAFNYSNTENIIKIIESDDCAFVIYDNFNVAYVNKENNLWRMQNPNLKDNTIIKNYDPLLLFIDCTTNEAKNKKLILIVDGLLRTNSETIIKDTLNSQFICIDIDSSFLSSGHKLYYTILNTDTEHYKITINNDIIDIY